MAGEGNSIGLGTAVIVALFLTAGFYATFGVVKHHEDAERKDRELVDADFAAATDCETQKLSILKEGVVGPLTVDHLEQAKGACEADQHPGERELVEADFGAASPCVRERLSALLDDDLPPVLTVDDLDAAQYWCDRAARIEEQRSALEAITNDGK